MFGKILSTKENQKFNHLSSGVFACGLCIHGNKQLNVMSKPLTTLFTLGYAHSAMSIEIKIDTLLKILFVDKQHVVKEQMNPYCSSTLCTKQDKRSLNMNQSSND